MEQHPVPQAITTYQFRLIGDMTLRQFSQLAGGVVVAIFFYSLPIVPFIKWLLIIFFGFLGFALAFLPIEDRPLDKWIVSFFKSVYSATQYLWKQQRKIPDFLKARPKKARPEEALQTTVPLAVSRARASEYLKTLSPRPFETKSEKQERLALEKIEALFQTTHLPQSIIPQIKKLAFERAVMPQIKVKPRKLVVPPSQSVALNIQVMPTTLPAAKTAAKRSLKLREVTPIRLKRRRRKRKKAIEAKTSPDLPIPTTPTQPNVIVGMTLDLLGKIIEKAIVEIRDKDGIPVRALRSNQLGQFQIVTPLTNGDYEIEVEKEGFEFDIIKLKLTGKIVEPIEIRAKRRIH